MRKELPSGVIAGIVVLVLVIIGFIAYRQFGGDPAAPAATREQIKAVDQMRASAMAPGVHRDAEGNFVDATGKPVNLSAAPTRSGQ